MTAYVESAVPKSVTLAVDVWMDAGASLTDAEVRALVEQKLRDYFTSIPIGGHIIALGAGRIPWRALIGQVEAASPFIIEARLTAETDVPMAIPEVATLTPVAVNVHHVIPAAA